LKFFKVIGERVSTQIFKLISLKFLKVTGKRVSPQILKFIEIEFFKVIGKRVSIKHSVLIVAGSYIPADQVVPSFSLVVPGGFFDAESGVFSGFGGNHGKMHHNSMRCTITGENVDRNKLLLDNTHNDMTNNMNNNNNNENKSAATNRSITNSSSNSNASGNLKHSMISGHNLPSSNRMMPSCAPVPGTAAQVIPEVLPECFGTLQESAARIRQSRLVVASKRTGGSRRST
jgi:hypothetical protein